MLCLAAPTPYLTSTQLYSSCLEITTQNFATLPVDPQSAPSHFHSQRNCPPATLLDRRNHLVCPTHIQHAGQLYHPHTLQHHTQILRWHNHLICLDIVLPCVLVSPSYFFINSCKSLHQAHQQKETKSSAQ